MFELERSLAGDDWTGLSTLIEKALQPGDCPSFNLVFSLANLGFADEVAKKLEEWSACDPLNPMVINALASVYIKAGRPEALLRLLDRAEAAGVETAFDGPRSRALLVAGQIDRPLPLPRGPTRDFFRYLMRGDEAEAQRIAKQEWDAPDMSLGRSLRYAALLGDRARANEYAARFDKYPGSATLLIGFINTCMQYARIVVGDGCRDGVPFDLEATPNLKARIEESGLQWPPVSFRDASTEAP
jgi:hypothetical protein